MSEDNTAQLASFPVATTAQAKATAPAPASSPTPAATAAQQAGFNEDLIKKYPRANRRIAVDVAPYGLLSASDRDHKAQTLFISPYGMEFHGTRDYPQGSLLKIHICLPDYWTRKQKFVDYRRVDTPDTFKVLAKVVRTEEIGKRGKKRLVVVQTVNIDEVDEQVLKSYLQEG